MSIYPKYEKLCKLHNYVNLHRLCKSGFEGYLDLMDTPFPTKSVVKLLWFHFHFLVCEQDNNSDSLSQQMTALFWSCLELEVSQDLSRLVLTGISPGNTRAVD